jgi:hypothetical protein
VKTRGKGEGRREKGEGRRQIKSGGLAAGRTAVAGKQRDFKNGATKATEKTEKTTYVFLSGSFVGSGSPFFDADACGTAQGFECQKGEG